MKLKIGLELHIQLDVKTKLFSITKNNVFDDFNTNVNSVDIGTPGSMPTLNKKAVELAVRLGFLLNSKISEKLYFDRKNYFYHDLPKGFQITQHYQPIAIGGSFEFLKDDNNFKVINIDSIILEEDTANSKFDNNNLYVDYNRSGIALIELVTKPDFNSALEVKFFLESIINMLKKSKISKAKFADGNIRVDVNVSVFENDLKKTNRVEIKNLNKLENIVESIKLEYEIQKKYLRKKIFNISITKKYDENSKNIIKTRKKMTEEEYLFIPETNILPIEIPKKIIEDTKNFIKKNKFILEKDFIKEFNLNFETNKFLFKNECLFNLFLDIFPKKYKNKEKIINLFKNISFLLEKNKCLNSEKVLDILNNDLNNKETIEVVKKIILNKNFNIKNYIKEKKEFENLYSEKQIENFCKYLLETDDNLILKYKNNTKSTKKYIMGKIMKWSHRKINPINTLKIIENYFEKLIK